MQLNLLKEITFISLSFDFFLLCPCTTEHWLAYQWWYAYHSFRNLALEDHGAIGLAGYSTTDPGTKCLRPTYPKANIITVFVDVLSSFVLSSKGEDSLRILFYVDAN
jgi:hypothetical protein